MATLDKLLDELKDEVLDCMPSNKKDIVYIKINGTPFITRSKKSSWRTKGYARAALVNDMKYRLRCAYNKYYGGKYPYSTTNIPGAPTQKEALDEFINRYVEFCEIPK